MKLWSAGVEGQSHTYFWFLNIGDKLSLRLPEHTGERSSSITTSVGDWPSENILIAWVVFDFDLIL
jgi:hypothetical protein